MKLTITLIFVTAVGSAFAQWTGQTSSSDVTSQIYRTGAISIDTYNTAQIRLNSSGTYYGKIGNPSSQVWSLGWGGATSDINPVLNWTATGNVGIGTLNPVSRLHVYNSSASTWLNIDKPSTSLEGGLQFSRAGTVLFYLWNDDVSDALKIEATGLPGETDATPRMEFPVSNKNIHMALSGGNVGIGTTTPGSFKLAVEGKIGAREVNVTTAAWSDYVFKDDYRLRPLTEVQEFIKENHHLPDVPSEKEVLQNGQDLGAMNAVLLKKIEELTLYVIEQNKLILRQNERIVRLEKK